LFRPEESWEGHNVLLFGTVMYDPHREDDRFRMWYLCYDPLYNEDYSERIKKQGRICYATSRDGIHWDRPQLGIHEFAGSTNNNIVIAGVPDSTCIVYDPLDSDPARRYKAQIRNLGHRAYFSPDGIHWTEYGRIPIDAYDRSTVHWDPVQRMWCASTKSFFRDPSTGTDRRGRGYQESSDFVNWGPVSFMCATPADSGEMVYNLEVFYYESMFLGIWGRYVADPDALLDIQLAVSPNGKHWERPFDEAWIPLSPLPADYVRVKLPHTPQTGVDPFDERVPWDYGNNSASSMGPVRVGDELWMYYSGRRTDHASSPHVGAIGLGTLRLDGFVSLDAADEEGVVLTRPLRLLHGSLHVNADASEGSLQVEILDDQGIPLLPFTRDNCEPICTDDVRHLVRWRGAKVMDFEELNGREIRLRFHLQNAELYSFWTGEEMSWSTPDTTTWKPGE